MKSREGNIVYITEKSDCAGEHIAGCYNNTCDLTGSNVVQNYLLLYHCRMARMRSGTRIAYIYIYRRAVTTTIDRGPDQIVEIQFA